MVKKGGLESRIRSFRACFGLFQLGFAWFLRRGCTSSTGGRHLRWSALAWCAGGDDFVPAGKAEGRGGRFQSIRGSTRAVSRLKRGEKWPCGGMECMREAWLKQLWRSAKGDGA